MRICSRVADGTGVPALALEFKLTQQAIREVLYKYGGKDKVIEDFSRKEAGKLVPLVDETDLLSAGMAQATDKLTRVFIRMALELNEEEISMWKPATKMKFLAVLGPLLKNVAKPMAPTQVNFFLKEAQTGEDLEKRLLEYATGRARKPVEE